jgi:hypothetical protein
MKVARHVREVGEGFGGSKVLIITDGEVSDKERGRVGTATLAG